MLLYFHGKNDQLFAELQKFPVSHHFTNIFSERVCKVKNMTFSRLIDPDRYTYLASDPKEADLTSNGVINSVSKKWPR